MVNNQCICDTNSYTIAMRGDVCLLTTNVQTMLSTYPQTLYEKVTIREIKSNDNAVSQTQEITSAIFSYYFLAAAVQCEKNKTTESCQTLANLCVLAQYYKTNSACALHITLSTTQTSLTRDFPNW